MKTIEEFINEINGSEALQNELEAVKNKDALEAFLKKNDVNGSAENFVKAVNELSDEDVEAAAGGFIFPIGFRTLHLPSVPPTPHIPL